MPALECRSVHFAYSKGHDVLAGVRLNAGSGEILGIVGPNGAGKSTLIKILGGLLAPSSGDVLLEGQSVHAMAATIRARRIAYVPQDYHLAFPFSVMEVVLSGRYPQGPARIFESREDLAVARRVLKWTGLSDLADRSFTDLSGGERQRATIAAALAQEPELILLDEPTSSLDVNHADTLMSLLDDLCKRQGLTAVMAVHDLSLASAWCPRLALLVAGRVKAVGAPEDVLSRERLKEVYGESVRRFDLDGTIVVAPRGRRNRDGG